MDLEEFQARLQRYIDQQGADMVSQFDLVDLEPVAERDLSHAERTLGVILPASYRRFMKAYGGGSIFRLELLAVGSADARDDLVNVNLSGAFENFVAVAPVGTGDWWGFASSNGECEIAVSLRDHEDGSIHFDASDFLSFVAKRGWGEEV
ncbi:SMI1/KNR4 family protein [Micromonospora sp. NPDC049051]|uniref:SMI1/KNR4 family protein n=1 Tax=Micromonospora sp. NPDC049051 TaxID=3364264 RepID=UPI00371DF1F5